MPEKQVLEKRPKWKKAKDEEETCCFLRRNLN
jgi:hypothetical protein